MNDRFGLRKRLLVEIYRQRFTFAGKRCPVLCLQTPLTVINTLWCIHMNTVLDLNKDINKQIKKETKTLDEI